MRKIARKAQLSAVAFAAAIMAVSIPVSAQESDELGNPVNAQCPASNILTTGIISNICWSCIFPLRIAGITLFGNTQSNGGSDANGFPLSSKPGVPADAANQTLCMCDDGPLPTVGIPVGMWVPDQIYETTYTPGCSSTLGGIRLGIADPLYLGTSGNMTGQLTSQSFNHIHSFSYPIVTMMELFTKCSTQYSDIDILYMSELDPMWNDPVVSMYGNPMSVFGTSLIAQAACSADAISSSVGNPIDDLFWCGGTWTSSLAPYTGYEHAQGPVQFTSATTLKLLAMDAARGLVRSTTGNASLCQAQYSPMLQRSNYRWQAAWPRAEASRNHASGESLLRWGAGRVVPGIADTPIYMRWSWTDCCAPLLGE